jgi:hypothetical protein
MSYGTALPGKIRNGTFHINSEALPTETTCRKENEWKEN